MPLEQSLDRKAMPLMRLVCGTEHIVQFADQVVHFRRWLNHLFDGDVQTQTLTNGQD
jgi:hypothetical protein